MLRVRGASLRAGSGWLTDATRCTPEDQAWMLRRDLLGLSVVALDWNPGLQSWLSVLLSVAVLLLNHLHWPHRGFCGDISEEGATVVPMCGGEAPESERWPRTERNAELQKALWRKSPGGTADDVRRRRGNRPSQLNASEPSPLGSREGPRESLGGAVCPRGDAV